MTVAPDPTHHVIPFGKKPKDGIFRIMAKYIIEHPAIVLYSWYFALITPFLNALMKGGQKAAYDMPKDFDTRTRMDAIALALLWNGEGKEKFLSVTACINKANWNRCALIITRLYIHHYIRCFGVGTQMLLAENYHALNRDVQFLYANGIKIKSDYAVREYFGFYRNDNKRYIYEIVNFFDFIENNGFSGVFHDYLNESPMHYGMLIPSGSLYGLDEDVKISKLQPYLYEVPGA